MAPSIWRDCRTVSNFLALERNPSPSPSIWCLFGVRVVATMMDVEGWDDTVRWKRRRKTQEPVSRLPIQQLPRRLPALGGLRIGSSCSGTLAEGWALKKLQVPHVHIFACDENDACRRFASENFHVHQWVNDVHNPEHRALPQVDIYVAGWSCQPFSKAGHQRGAQDDRSQIIWPIMGYVRKAMPKLVVLENVNTILAKRYEDHMNEVMKCLNAIRNDDEEPAYTWSMRVLCSRDFQLPQIRKRVYIIGVRTDSGQTPTWPAPLPRVGLSAIYDAPHDQIPITDNHVLGKTATENITASCQSITSAGLVAEDYDFVIDVHAGRGGCLTFDCMPTITRSRGASRAYVFTRWGTRVSLSELMRCQGFVPEDVRLASVTERQAGEMIGNAMSINVLQHVIRANLHACH